MTLLDHTGDRLWGLSAPDAVAAVGGDADGGLSDEEAAARLARWGPNTLPRERSHGVVARLLMQCHSPLVYVLVVAAARPGNVTPVWTWSESSPSGACSVRRSPGYASEMKPHARSLDLSTSPPGCGSLVVTPPLNSPGWPNVQSSSY
jgi:hypothetical protein